MRRVILPMIKMRPLVLVVVLAGIAAVAAWIEHRENVRFESLIASSQIAYRNARIVRERAEAQLEEYVEITVPQELASAEAEIGRAEDDLKLIRNGFNWSEKIQSKGWLLLYRGPSKDLAVKKATFDLEYAQSRKRVLEGYTKAKTERELSDRIARTRADELEKKAAYLKLLAEPRGFFRRLMRQK